MLENKSYQDTSENSRTAFIAPRQGHPSASQESVISSTADRSANSGIRQADTIAYAKEDADHSRHEDALRTCLQLMIFD